MGRFGIILAFLLSVVAAGGSYYLYQGWVEERTVRGSIEAKYDQVKEKMITVQSENEQVKAQSEEYRTKAEAMQSQLEKLQSEQSRMDSEKAALETQLKTHQEMIAELQTKMADLERKAKEAQAACGVTPADLKTGPVAMPQPSETTEPATVTPEPGASQVAFKPVPGGVASVENAKPFGEESESAPSAEKEEASVAPTPAPAASAPAVSEPVPSPKASAPVESVAGAKVLTVNRKFNFVVVNQGLQEGLKMGDKLKVLKNGKEVATVQVEKLYDKFSAATLVEEDPKQQVVEGDEVRKV